MDPDERASWIFGGVGALNESMLTGAANFTGSEP